MTSISMFLMSVVIPTHNRLEQLGRLLDSLSCQQYPPEWYEVIVVDDGSQDGTAEFLASQARKGRLQWVHHPRVLGPASARNTGARLARGKFLVFTDDDCFVEPGWLEEYRRVFETTIPPPAAAGGPILNVTSDHWIQKFYAVQNTRHQINMKENPSFLDTANAAFRRDVFWELGGFNEHYPYAGTEDVEFGYRLLQARYTIHRAPKAVVHHYAEPRLHYFLKAPYVVGFGMGIMMMDFPNVFANPQPGGLRGWVRRGLDAAAQKSSLAPRVLRPFIYPPMAAFRRFVYDLAGIPLYFKGYWTTQRQYYRDLGLEKTRLVFYLGLEIVVYLLHLCGHWTGTLAYSYRQTRSIRKEVG